MVRQTRYLLPGLARLSLLVFLLSATLLLMAKSPSRLNPPLHLTARQTKPLLLRRPLSQHLKHLGLALPRRLPPKLQVLEAIPPAVTPPAVTPPAAMSPEVAPQEAPTRPPQAPPPQIVHPEAMPQEVQTRPLQILLQQAALPGATPLEASTRPPRIPPLLPRSPKLLPLLKLPPHNRLLKLAKPAHPVRLTARHLPHLSRPSKAMLLLSRHPLASSALLWLVSPFLCFCDGHEKFYGRVAIGESQSYRI